MQLFKRKFFESGITALIISNKEMDNIMKMVKSLEEPDLFIKGVSEIIKKRTKRTKSR